MIHAELSNKCGQLRDREDILTSTVFCYLKYNIFRDELIAFLGEAVNIRTGKKYVVPGWLKNIDSSAFLFWERLEYDKEPDLRIEKSKDEHIVIEVKFNSKEQKGQLSKYLSCVSENVPVLYITLDWTLNDALSSSLHCESEYGQMDKDRIYWLSWHFLHKVLSNSRNKTENCSFPGEKRTKREMTDDLLMFLENRGISFFDGFAAKNDLSVLSSPIFWTPVFFAQRLPNVQKRDAPVFWGNVNEH